MARHYLAASCGEVSESAEGARLLSEYTGLNLYRGFKSLPLRQFSVYPGSAQSKKFFLASNQVKRTVRPRGLTAIDIHRF